jgi:hypothetical protein
MSEGGNYSTTKGGYYIKQHHDTQCVRQMPLVHQCHTCNNNPFHILSNDDEDDDTVVASNCSLSTPPTIIPASIPSMNPPTRQALRRLMIPTPIPPHTVPPRHLPTTPPLRVQATQTVDPAITLAAPYSPVHALSPVPSQKSLVSLSYTKQ